MKLIKALAATAFSAALFAPASFAATSSTDSESITFEHGQNYECSIAYDSDNKSEFELQTTGPNKDSITGGVEGITISNNGATDVTFSASGSSPVGTAFSMEAAGGEGGFGTDITAEDVADDTSYNLEVAFSNGATPGSYSATVVVSCVYGGEQSFD